MRDKMSLSTIDDNVLYISKISKRKYFKCFLIKNDGCRTDTFNMITHYVQVSEHHTTLHKYIL